MGMLDRALSALAQPNAVLAPLPKGQGYGVFPLNDRRRRPVVRLTREQVGELESEGAVSSGPNGMYHITEAGRARSRRAQALPGEAFAAQHQPLVDRHALDQDGNLTIVRGHDPDLALRRLGAMRDGAGRPWLSTAELAAAARLKRDWAIGQIAQVRGSDWSAPPRGAEARGPGNTQERLAGARCDARRRVEESLSGLAPALRRAVEQVCLHERGLEALELSEGWPARSGKLALKLALAQLARA